MIWQKKYYFQELSGINCRQHYYSPKSRDSKVIAENLNLQSTFWFISSKLNKIAFWTKTLNSVTIATAYLTSNELNNLDNEIFHCINQLKVWKKYSNIDNLYKQIIKINDFKEISKDYLGPSIKDVRTVGGEGVRVINQMWTGLDRERGVPKIPKFVRTSFMDDPSSSEVGNFIEWTKDQDQAL